MGLFATLFKPNDERRRKAVDDMVQSRHKLEQAVNRLEETVTEMLNEHDKFTKRRRHPNERT